MTWMGDGIIPPVTSCSVVDDLETTEIGRGHHAEDTCCNFEGTGSLLIVAENMPPGPLNQENDH